MLEEELKDLIHYIQSYKAETQNIEIKAAHMGCPKKLYNTLSSFSNNEGGGTIIFGIDEEKEFQIVGVYEAHDLQQKINEQCKQMLPVIRPLFTMIDIDKKIVVSAEIPEVDISEKPCFYTGAGRIRGSYVRVGDSDESMTEYEIYSYEAFRLKYHDEERVVKRITMENLDQQLLNTYMSGKL